MSDARETIDDVIREYIAFIDSQVGMYTDALAGFKGHYARVETQVAKVLRPTKQEGQTIVWTSYEDSSSPDIILNRTIRAADYLAVNAPDGGNEVQHACAVLIFVFTAWDDEFRPRLASAAGIAKNRITSDVMGDLRHLRHAILHMRGILRREKWTPMKLLNDMFLPDLPIKPGYRQMHTIFELIKKDCARLALELLNAPQEVIDLATQIAIQRVR
jgi:hypothetical protein